MLRHLELLLPGATLSLWDLSMLMATLDFLSTPLVIISGSFLAYHELDT